MRETENKLPLVDPNPPETEDALAEAPEEDPEGEVLDEPERTADRSLKRLVEPRMAPRLAAPEPILALRAALAEPPPPAPSAEEDGDEESPPANELKLAEEAAAVLVVPVEPEEPIPDETTLVPPPPDRRLDPSRPRPLRLPCNWGTRRAAKRSAWTVPLSRIVRVRSPVSTTAVATGAAVPPPDPN